MDSDFDALGLIKPTNQYIFCISSTFMHLVRQFVSYIISVLINQLINSQCLLRMQCVPGTENSLLTHRVAGILLTYCPYPQPPVILVADSLALESFFRIQLGKKKAVSS